ncbi:hypothetical protein KGA66_15215 [Actinocrinis puniceicyclus]|uniref:Uncharacterized protein n=1 Tax=Actinocrinis puniceicyclus TaxID=977794 RepID=A0A8J7WL96_9ACTN|nr:hypothetical protein [Actinocrinis puniceicyclus]MBS2964406.1 hypothetical protein [Actinocrinis puniceicyclus]
MSGTLARSVPVPGPATTAAPGPAPATTAAPIPAPAPAPAGRLAGPAHWGVRAAVRLGFPGRAALAEDAAHTALLRTYLSDLLKQDGLSLDEEKFAAGGHSYGEMAEELLRLTVPPGEAVDLLVLASAVPDLTPGRSTAIYLSHVCPGSPLALAIGDQGAVAAFTGLRLAGEYARTDALHSTILLVVEQASLPYDTGSAPMPAENAAVALLLGDSTVPVSLPAAAAGRPRHPARLGEVKILADVQTDEAAVCALEAAAAGLGGPSDTALILGPGLAEHAGDLADRFLIHHAHPGRPATGTWWELAGMLNEPRRPARSVLLAEYDPESATLALAAFHV